MSKWAADLELIAVDATDDTRDATGDGPAPTAGGSRPPAPLDVIERRSATRTVLATICREHGLDTASDVPTLCRRLAGITPGTVDALEVATLADSIRARHDAARQAARAHVGDCPVCDGRLTADADRIECDTCGTWAPIAAAFAAYSDETPDTIAAVARRTCVAGVPVTAARLRRLVDRGLIPVACRDNTDRRLIRPVDARLALLKEKLT